MTAIRTVVTCTWLQLRRHTASVLPNDTSTTTFSCIQYSDDGNGVAGTAEATYECTRPAYLLSTLASCSDVTAGATGSDGEVVHASFVEIVASQCILLSLARHTCAVHCISHDVKKLRYKVVFH